MPCTNGLIYAGSSPSALVAACSGVTALPAVAASAELQVLRNAVVHLQHQLDDLIYLAVCDVLGKGFVRAMVS